jgi:hypothetical protein
MRLKRSVSFCFVVAAGLLFAATAFAHHSTAEYNMNKSSSVVGTVTEFAWNNPHPYIYLDVKNDKGEIEKWSGELAALPMMSRAGWTRNSVKPGDRITMHGNPAKDGRFLLRLDKITLPNGQDLLTARVSVAN